MAKINIVKESRYAIKKVDVIKIPRDIVVAWKIYHGDGDGGYIS